MTALADALREALIRQAGDAGTSLAIPQGALMGLDRLREWRRAWEEVCIRFCKEQPASGVSGTGMFESQFASIVSAARLREAYGFV